MPTRLTFNGTHILLPSECLVCQKPAEKDYKISRSFSIGNRTDTITIPMPLCTDHFSLAELKTPSEQKARKVGMVFSALVGIIAGLAMMLNWISGAHGDLFMTLISLILGAFVGFFVYLILNAIWANTITTRYANPQSKAVRSALKITRYWPNTQNIELEFTNPAVAELIAQGNKDHLVSKN
jgi:hypothetical protein